MKRIIMGHSPDADDAFMFYGFAKGLVALEGYVIEQRLEDIESLNRRALRGEYEVTAISAALYPKVADTYQIMRTGVSMGRGYGPRLLVREPQPLETLKEGLIAVPGEYTTAYLVLRLLLDDFRPAFVDFLDIPRVVREGEVAAGLVIHESQLTYEAEGLHLLVDLGRWWQEETGLPLPLGVDVVRRDLPEDLRLHIRKAWQESIRAAYAHEEDALDYALQFGRGLDRETGRRFVRMYVNEDTIDMGEEGERALKELFTRAHAQGLIRRVPPVDLI